MSNKALINTRNVSMIELRQLRYFLALADKLHFAKAAASVNVTQPSLSRQIAALEQELGCELFLRNSRSVVLTAAGKELQRHGKTLLQNLETTLRSTQAVARGERGELRIAFTSMLAWTAFPNLVKRYSLQYPDVTINLTELLPTELIRAVQSGEHDLCLAFKTHVKHPLAYQALHSETLSIALPCDHRLAGQDSVSLELLKDEPFILSPETVTPALHAMIMGLCRDAGFEPVVRMHTHLQGTIVNLVAEGLGVAIVPAAMAQSGKTGVRFLPLPASPTLELGLVWNEDNLNPCLEGFRSVASQTV
jgi:DNA-binding transcriptional LysR family regulator